MSGSGRLAYLTCTLVATALGTVTVATSGGPTSAVAMGAGLAWLVQAPAAWTLAGGLARGERVAGRWAAGLGARVAGAGVTVLAAPLVGVGRRPALVAYAAAMVAFLLGEAGWLWWSSSAADVAPPNRPDAGHG